MKHLSIRITFFLLSFSPICLNARTNYKCPIVEHAKEYLMQQIKQGADPASIHQQIKDLEAIDQLFLHQSFASTGNNNVNIVQKLDSIISIISTNIYSSFYYKYDIEHQRLSSYGYKWSEDSYDEFTYIFDDSNRQTGLEYVYYYNREPISGSHLEFYNDNSKNIDGSTSHNWKGTPDNIVSFSSSEYRYNSNNVLIYYLNEEIRYDGNQSLKIEEYYYDNGNLKTHIWYDLDENGTWVQSSKEEYFTDGTYNFYGWYGLRESRYLNKYRNTLTTDYYGWSDGKHYLNKREIECRHGDKICFQNKTLTSRTEYIYNEDGSVQEGKMEEFNNNEYGTCIYKWDKNVNNWRLSEQIATGGVYTWTRDIQEGDIRGLDYSEPGYNIHGWQIFHDGRWYYYGWGSEYEIEWTGSYSEDEGSAIISNSPIRSFSITVDTEKWINYCSESITTLNSQHLPFQTIDYNNGVIYQQTFYSYNSDNETTEVNTYAIDGASMKLSKRVVYDYDYSANMSEVLGLPGSPYCVSQMTRFKNKPLSIKTYDGDGNLISIDKEWFYSGIDETEGLPQNWYDDPDDSGDVFYNLQGQKLQSVVPEQIIINNKRQKVYTKQ